MITLLKANELNPLQLNQLVERLKSDSKDDSEWLEFLVRAALDDSDILVVAAVHEDVIVGHVLVQVCTVQTNEKVGVVHKCRVSRPGLQILDLLVEYVDNWLGMKGVSVLRTEVSPDYSEKAWLRVLHKYGFKTIRYVLERRVQDA